MAAAKKQPRIPRSWPPKHLRDTVPVDFYMSHNHLQEQDEPVLDIHNQLYIEQFIKEVL